MKLVKLLWAVRALFYKARLKKIGNFCYIGKPVFISGSKHIAIGDKVRIFPGIRLEVVDDDGFITIEDNISIGQNVHITSKKYNLIIGKNTTIVANSFITNIDHDYTKIGEHIMNQEMIAANTVIGENCFIGYGAGIQAGTILGKHCVVGCNSVVRGVFPDYCVLVGSPAKIVKRYNFETQLWENY